MLKVDLELNRSPPILSYAKLYYFEKNLSDLQQKYTQSQESLKMSKQMLDKTLSFVNDLKEKNINEDQLEQFNNEVIKSLRLENNRLKKQVQNSIIHQQLDRDRLLISQQIREQQDHFHREVLKEYETRICELRLLIQQKQKHIQNLEEIEDEFDNTKVNKPKKRIVRAFEQQQGLLILIQQLKIENQKIRKFLTQEKQIVKQLKNQNKYLRQSCRIQNDLKINSNISNIDSQNIDPKSKTNTFVTQCPSTQTSIFGKISSENPLPFRCDSLAENLISLIRKQQLNNKLLLKDNIKLKTIINCLENDKKNLIKTYEVMKQQLYKYKKQHINKNQKSGFIDEIIPKQKLKYIHQQFSQLVNIYMTTNKYERKKYLKNTIRSHSLDNSTKHKISNFQQTIKKQQFAPRDLSFFDQSVFLNQKVFTYADYTKKGFQGFKDNSLLQAFNL